MKRFYQFGRTALLLMALLLTASVVAKAQWTEYAVFADSGRSWGQFAYLNGTLYCFGGLAVPPGSTSGYFSAGSVALDVSGGSGSQWTKIKDMPVARAGGYAAAINGKIYIVGGYHASTPVLNPEVVVYDPNTDSYETKASMPYPAYQIAAAVIGTKIYVINGYGSAGTTAPTNNVQVYDTDNDTWTQLNTSPFSSGYSTASAVGSTIYLFSGSGTGGTYLTSAYKGTISGNTITWTAIKNFPNAATRVGSGVLKGSLYAAGGANGATAYANTYRYNDTTNTWVSTFQLPVGTYNTNSLPSDGNALYYVSGYQNLKTFKFSEGVASAAASVTPTSITVTLKTGTSTSTQLSVKNLGTAALTCQIQITGAPWLTTDKSNFTVQPGSTTIVNVTMNSAGMTEGDYHADIVLSTNDPNKPTVTVPVTMSLVDNAEPRRPMLETFSSSTCGPCYNGNKNLHAVLDTINDRSKYTVVKYQQDFPSTGDPYATDETVASTSRPSGTVSGRRGYYGINAIPWMMVDGGWNGNSQSFTTSIFNQYANVLAYLKINSVYEVIGQKIRVQVTITPLKDFTSTNLRLMIAVCEKLTSANIKTNGETQFHDVVKKMLPDQLGTTIGPLQRNVPITIIKEYTFPGSYSLPSNGTAASRIDLSTGNTVEHFDSLEAAVWVQDYSTKEVLNSSWSVSGTVGVNDRTTGLNFNVSAVSPNPTSGKTQIQYTLANSANVGLALYDLTGRLVLTLEESRKMEAGQHSTEFDATTIPAGSYSVVLVSGGERIAKSILIVH